MNESIKRFDLRSRPRVARYRAISALVFVLLSSIAVAARAGGGGGGVGGGAAPECPELPCSVNRNCSSTGMACEAGDRGCAEEARSKALEVKCEQQCLRGARLVYCPPDTGRSDSKVVWILLAMALTLAVGGTLLAWLVLRKKGS